MPITDDILLAAIAPARDDLAERIEARIGRLATINRVTADHIGDYSLVIARSEATRQSRARVIRPGLLRFARNDGNRDAKGIFPGHIKRACHRWR